MAHIVLMPGYVMSQNDFDDHWISANDLAVLWGIPAKLCIVSDGTDSAYTPDESDIVLGPRFHGSYVKLLQHIGVTAGEFIAAKKNDPKLYMEMFNRIKAVVDGEQ